jgi:hypothetical protein
MRTSRQNTVVNELADEAILFGFLYPYIDELHARQKKKIHHKLDPATFYPVARFIVEACIAGLTYDIIKKTLKRAFAKCPRLSLFEWGHTDFSIPRISIGRCKIGTITMSLPFQERLLDGTIKYLSKSRCKRRLKGIPPLERLPSPARKQTKK